MLTLLSLLLFAAPAYQESEIFVEVEAVNVIVTVMDRDGRFVTDIPRSRFRIFEDEFEQTITNFISETEMPLKIGLLIDTSSSVRMKLDFEKQAATNFIRSIMRRDDLALLVEFDQGVSLLHDFTRQPTSIVREIKKLRAGGGTALLDAIYTVSRDKMIGQESRKTLVVLSDGQDLNSVRNLDETLDMAKDAGVVIYSIGTSRFGASVNRKGEKMLQHLSEQTGGRAFFPYSADLLNEAFELINQELRSQYSLTYVPTNKLRDGTYREIEVKLKDGKKLSLRYRKGYFAPTEPPDPELELDKESETTGR
jgi:VWFA-related protein